MKLSNKVKQFIIQEARKIAKEIELEEQIQQIKKQINEVHSMDEVEFEGYEDKGDEWYEKQNPIGKFKKKGSSLMDEVEFEGYEDKGEEWYEKQNPVGKFKKKGSSLMEDEDEDENAQEVDDIMSSLEEAVKWQQKAKVKRGAMHKALNIPDGDDIKDHYTSGKKLAKDLIDAVGLARASRMINYAANANKDKNSIFDVAQRALKNM